MPIQMKDYGPNTGPVFVCDYCGQTIEKLSEGVLAHRQYGGEDKVEVFILHQDRRGGRRCHEEFEKSHPLPKSQTWGWDHLGRMLFYLINASGAEWEELRNYDISNETTPLLSQLGKLTRQQIEEENA